MGKWDMGTELRTQGMNWDKRRKSDKDDTDLLDSDKSDPAAEDPDEGGRHARPHKTRPKDGQADGEEVARVMKANDNHDNNNEDEDEERGGKQPKKGKKAKHAPGSHHRDDRHPSSVPEDESGPSTSSKKHHSKQKRPDRKAKGKHTNDKRYLSSNPRYHEKKELSFWDYDRHIKRIGDFDPLHGTGLREEVATMMERRGHGADERNGKGKEGGRHSRHGDGIGGTRHAKHGAKGKGRHAVHAADDELTSTKSGLRHDDFHATNNIDGPHINAISMEQGVQVRGDSLPDLHEQDTLPSHRQGVTLGDGSTSAQSLASPAGNHHGASPGGVVPVPVSTPSPHTKEARGLLDNLRVDNMLDLDSEAYDCEEEYGHGHHTLFGRDENQDWQPAPETAPAPSPPQQVSVVDGGPRLFADRIIWQPKSDHPEKHGGLERRRKNKHKDHDEDDEDGGKHGRNRHDDDYEDEDDEYGSGSRKIKSKHLGDEDEESYGLSSEKKGKGSYNEDEEGYEDDYSAKGTGRSRGKGAFDDDVPYSKSNPLSGFDEDEDGYPTKPKSKSKFDDGQYRPSTYANSGIDDCATLSSFYVSMRGETWSPPVDWSASAVSSASKASCCTWTGVTCDEYERVIGVDVSSLGLAGPLGSELFSLDALLRL
jgi:hypothetical protein